MRHHQMTDPQSREMPLHSEQSDKKEDRKCSVTSYWQWLLAL